MDNEQVAGAGNGQPTDEATRTRAQAWADRVRQAKKSKKLRTGFAQMRKDMKFAEGLQWDGQESLDDPRYVANVTLRHLLQRRAALYARNPTAVARKRKTLDFQMWDGDPQSLMMAQQTLAIAQQDPMAAQDPAVMQQLAQAQALLQDYQQGSQRRRMLDLMADTMEIVWNYQVGEQQPPFKTSMKSMVMRTLVCSVGYVKLGFHRMHDYSAEDAGRVTDISEQIAALEARLDQAEDGEVEQDSEEMAELRSLLRQVTENAETFVREGLDFDFPPSDTIIPDPACRVLKGFVGARWVAQEFLLTGKQIQEIYKHDLSKSKAKKFDGSGAAVTGEAEKSAMIGEDCGQDDRYMVYEIWDKHTREVMTVCEGYEEFLEEPAAPAVQLERFWPFFALVFNDVETKDNLYPPSDVRLMAPMQQDRNLSRQRLREHRDAARPGHMTPKGRMDEEDKSALQRRSAHEIIEINGMAEQDDVRRMLQPIPTNPIDPNLYEVGTAQEDINLTVGSQDAVLGAVSGATATETSIAESSRLSSVGEAVDELDDFLTELARAGSQLLLSEFSPEYVQEIAGVGAVWPDATAPEVARDLWLEIRAGSSGRPNKAMDIQNLERVAPFLLQIPGMKPKRLAQEFLERMDDRLEVDDFFDPMLPSITQANSAKAPGTGDPSTDPEQQGAHGGDPNAVETGDSNLGPRPPAEPRNMDPNR